MKKSQGEIFGIALLFVIIIIGIIIYGQIKASNPDEPADLIYKGKYGILAETTLDTLLKTSTGCVVERNRDRIIDLVSYCQENSFFADADPEIYCEGSFFQVAGDYPSCSTVVNIINETLENLFNSSDSALGHILYNFSISVPSAPNTKLGTISVDNFNSISITGGGNLNSKNYYRYGFKKAPSGLRSLPTANRNVDFELYLFYK
ncbi:MAG: hypothetical protein KC589_08070 [Nanoarchaeota archaeon]|nr:hypothetical protein [Nanoarchaeota archaeon]